MAAMKTRLLLIAFIFSIVTSVFAQDSLHRLSDSFENLVDKVSPAVVKILVTGYGSEANSGTTGSLLTESRYSGSGVIVDPAGFIVTNAHVVGTARQVQVLLAFGEQRGPGKSIVKSQGKVVDAKLVGVDSETDLAVLKIEEPNPPHLEFGNSDSLKAGQIVLAFGSPLGLENSVTMGIVSAVARQLKPEDPMIYIQTDAPINPGNSGGPLVDTDGYVVGINSSIYTYSGGSEGVGFAAPSNIVRNVFQQLKNNGSVRRGEIGVSAQTITPDLASALSLPRDWGVIVSDVIPGGASERSGLKIGDIILSVDGKILENGRQFDVTLYRRSEKDTVTLEILRGSESLTFHVPVTLREDEDTSFAKRISPEKNAVPSLGVFVFEIDDEIAKMIPWLRKQYGVVVAARMVDAPYWASELKPGDVIHSVNGTLITSLDQLRSVLGALKPGSPVALQIERTGRLSYVAFRLE